MSEYMCSLVGKRIVDARHRHPDTMIEDTIPLTDAPPHAHKHLRNAHTWEYITRQTLTLFLWRWSGLWPDVWCREYGGLTGNRLKITRVRLYAYEHESVSVCVPVSKAVKSCHIHPVLSSWTWCWPASVCRHCQMLLTSKNNAMNYSNWIWFMLADKLCERKVRE